MAIVATTTLLVLDDPGAPQLRTRKRRAAPKFSCTPSGGLAKPGLGALMRDRFRATVTIVIGRKPEPFAPSAPLAVAMHFSVENFERFARGEPLKSVVNKRLGY